MYVKVKYEPRICAWCGNPFTPKRSHGETCSARCSYFNSIINRVDEYCPMCEKVESSYVALVEHVKTAHHRLIDEYDINRAEEERRAKWRAIEDGELTLLRKDDTYVESEAAYA